VQKVQNLVFNLLFLWPGRLAAAAAMLFYFATGGNAQGPVFGPVQFTRAAGAPQTVNRDFPRCGTGTCRITVTNGNANGSNRVTSATISLNGAQLFGPANFNQNVATLTAAVTLADTNQLSVRLNSAPGSFLTVTIDCGSTAKLVIGPDILSTVWATGVVSLAIPLANAGNAPAEDITIGSIQATGGTYTGPTAVPYPAGDIDPDEDLTIAAQLTMASTPPPPTFPITISGSYGFGTAMCTFTAQGTASLPPAGNGGTPKLTTSIPVFNVNTAVFTPPLPRPSGELPNKEEEGFIPPLGQPRNLFTTPPAASLLDLVRAFVPNDQAPPAGASPNDVVFLRNQNGGSYGGLPPDPNVAGSTPSGFAMVTANTAVSYSTNFGSTFTTVNLTSGGGFNDPGRPSRTDFFPENDGGLCCDQVLHYIPSRNLMVWLLQYWSPSINVGGLPQLGQNRLRIAFATPQAAAADFLGAWTWFDISPATLGDNTVTDWMDYPDLAFSNDWLYISVDHGFWNANKDSNGNVIGQKIRSDRRWFVRASLNDMASGAGSINLVYYEPIKTGLAKTHFAQSAPDTMYYAAQPDSSTLSVFADPDSSPNVPSPKDIGISSYCPQKALSSCDFSVNAPDNLNWNVAPQNGQAAAYSAPPVFCPPTGCTGPTRFIYFAFDGSRDTSAGRAYPYVRVEKVDADALNLVSELDIWNSGFAFATPALTWRPGISSKDEIAISLAVGGGGTYADNAVGFLGDFVVYVTTGSNGTQAVNSGGSTVVRYGDYFGVRNAIGPTTPFGQGVGYSTLGYGVSRVNSGQTCAVGGCNVNLQYVLFGRNADLFPSPPVVVK
jgi:hypothetical protein